MCDWTKPEVVNLTGNMSSKIIPVLFQSASKWFPRFRFASDGIVDRFQPALARRFTFNAAHFIKKEVCRISMTHVKPGLGQGVHVFALRASPRRQVSVFNAAPGWQKFNRYKNL